jgi:hypothetical protein
MVNPKDRFLRRPAPTAEPRHCIGCQPQHGFRSKIRPARELIAPLIAGQHPNDQFLLMSFSDHVETFKELTAEERRRPEQITIPRSGIDRGTALYDALASALCRMRNAENRKQAVVLLTDGADQHSRLPLQPLVELARMSTPQVFMIGFFNRTEAQVFKQGGKTVTLLGSVRSTTRSSRSTFWRRSPGPNRFFRFPIGI